MSDKVKSRESVALPSLPHCPDCGMVLTRRSVNMVCGLWCMGCNGYRVPLIKALPSSPAPTIHVRTCSKYIGKPCDCGVPPTSSPTAEDLVRDLARELYDRFVMGGWQPQDAYPMIRAMLADHLK